MGKAEDMALLQTAWTREQAIDWAERRYKRSKCWPSRRFRVDGSRAGNSRLLSKGEAATTQEQYGGTIVELIPERAEYMAEFLGVRLDGQPVITVSTGLPACPTCETPAGAPCRRDNGEARWPHRRRIAAAGYATPEAAMESTAAGYDRCDRCDANPGRACTKRDPADEQGRARMTWWPHRLRKLASKADKPIGIDEGNALVGEWAGTQEAR